MLKDGSRPQAALSEVSMSTLMGWLERKPMDDTKDFRAGRIDF